MVCSHLLLKSVGVNVTKTLRLRTRKSGLFLSILNTQGNLKSMATLKIILTLWKKGGAASFKFCFHLILVMLLYRERLWWNLLLLQTREGVPGGWLRMQRFCLYLMVGTPLTRPVPPPPRAVQPPRAPASQSPLLVAHLASAFPFLFQKSPLIQVLGPLFSFVWNGWSSALQFLLSCNRKLNRTR